MLTNLPNFTNVYQIYRIHQNLPNSYQILSHFTIFSGKIWICALCPNFKFSFYCLKITKCWPFSLKWKRFPQHCHNIKWVSGLVSRLWRYILECSGLRLCDSADNIRSKILNMAGMWPWVTKKLLKWETAKNILFHSKLIFSGKTFVFPFYIILT